MYRVNLAKQNKEKPHMITKFKLYEQVSSQCLRSVQREFLCFMTMCPEISVQEEEKEASGAWYWFVEMCPANGICLLDVISSCFV